MNTECVIGVDLGGTNVRAAAVDKSGKIIGTRVEIPSRAQEGTLAILDSLTSAISQVQSSIGVAPQSIGLSVPGHIDNAAGLVRWAPNFGHSEGGVFYYWKDVPLKKSLEERVGVPVAMGNDANCAALGEYRFGSGNNSASCLVLLTLGTGIGGGVVLSPKSVDGKAQGPLLLLGGNKGGAELGHVTIAHGGLDCNAGSYGAIEAYCQRDAIVRRAQHKLRRGRDSQINNLVGGDYSLISPRILSQAADSGDELAQEVWREVGMYLGAAIGSFINIFSPDIFAIGGQVSKVGKWLLEPAIAEARNIAIPSLMADCQVVPAEQIDDAGLLGASALAFESHI